MQDSVGIKSALDCVCQMGASRRGLLDGVSQTKRVIAGLVALNQNHLTTRYKMDLTPAVRRF